VSWIPPLPVPVGLGGPGVVGPDGVSRSYPDAATIVWCAGGAVDAEWDRPAPRMPRRLLRGADEPGEAAPSVPFWVGWTAKEAMYKVIWRDHPFVPADHPVRSLREERPTDPRILRFFTWHGGFTACVPEPGPAGRRLWISVAAPAPRRKSET